MTVLDIHATGIANLSPFRYRGYYYDVETKLYFLKTRYYDPEIGRFLTIDDISYLDPDSINGLNLYAYCGNNPVMGYDPNGTTDCEDDWDWSPLLTLAVAMGVVVGVTAVTATGVGVVAYALGASAATISAITTTAAIGGIVAGSIEIGIQVAENGLSGMDLGSIAIESFIGTGYGAITGASILTTSIPLKLGLRGARVALGGANTLLHGINNGDSKEIIASDTFKSIRTGIIIQGSLSLFMIGGASSLSTKEIIKMSGIIVGKDLWRNYGQYIGRTFKTVGLVYFHILSQEIRYNASNRIYNRLYSYER